MQYVRSVVSGVQRLDQWDQFLYPRCHTVYEYRQRKQMLRVVDNGARNFRKRE